MGGGFIHIFMFCPTSFFWNQIQIYQFEKKLVGQNMNIWINTPPNNVLATALLVINYEEDLKPQCHLLSDVI